MKPATPRDLLAQAIIVLAICIGGWMMLVSPKIEQAARLEAEIAAMSTLAGTPSDQAAVSSVQEAAERVGSIKQRLSEIRELNLMAEDSSRLYGAVMDLADAHGVQVQSLQPGTLKQTSEDKRSSFTRLNVTVEGTYQNIAKFLEDVCELNAFIRPVLVGISPSRDSARGETVEAVFNCDIVKFAIADSLNVLEGVSHGQR